MKTFSPFVFSSLFFLFAGIVSAQTFPQKEINSVSASMQKQMKEDKCCPNPKGSNTIATFKAGDEHSVASMLHKLSSNNIPKINLKNAASVTPDTITIGGDTLIVGYTANDTLRIMGNWTHVGPIIVLNTGVLIFKHANATIVGDIYIVGHAKAFSDSSTLYFPQQYWYQRSILVVQDGYLNFSNTTFNYGGFPHGFSAMDSAKVFLTNITNNDYTTTGMNGHASITINKNNLTGEFIIMDYVNLHLKNATNALLWHQFPDTAVVNYSFPNGTTVNSYHFNKTTAGIKGIEYNVQVDTSHSVNWAMMPVNGSNIHISNSAIRSIGLWFMGTDSCTVSGLVDNSNYSSFTAPLSDRNLQFTNTSVQTWSLYPMQKSVVNLSGSIVGEIGTEGKSKLTGTNYSLDGSGGYCWTSDTSSMVNVSATIASNVRSEKNSIQLFAYSTESSGAPTAIGKSVLIVVQSTIPQDPIPYEGSCVWLANIAQPTTSYVDSMVAVTGSAWIDKTPISTWMDFGKHHMWYKKAADTIWTHINNFVTAEVRNNVLCTWNTHGLAAGAYNLRLVLYDNWGDSVEAVKAVTLLPAILLSANDNTLGEMNVNVYPNPSNSQFTVSGLRFPVQLQVYNIVGEKIYSTTVDSKQETVNLSSQPNGIYFLQIKSSEGMLTKKIEVIH